MFFALGFTFYGSLMAGWGAMVPNLREGSQSTFVFFPSAALYLAFYQYADFRTARYPFYRAQHAATHRACGYDDTFGHRGRAPLACGCSYSAAGAF